MTARPKPEKPNRILPVRSERGYSATNYDQSSAIRTKSVRSQFGQKYDQKKVRNRQPVPICLRTELPNEVRLRGSRIWHDDLHSKPDL